MSQHTPGPWTIFKRPDHPDISIEREVSEDVENRRSSFSQGVCDIGQFECRARPIEAMANAHLIAAAPDLLAALKYVVTVLDEEDGEHRKRIDVAEEAIRKAEGAS